MMKRDLKWMAGQRMMAGFAGTEITDDLRALVKEYKVGNIILFKHNVVSIFQLRALCAELKELVLAETGLPPLIAIDQEGGVVSRLPEGCAVTPTAMAIAATGSTENALTAGRIIGQELRALGVNLDFAPVADVNNNPRNPVIGARSFGDDPATVSAYTMAMTAGIRESGVLACAKHFPGHGDTDVDSHLGLPRVEKTLEELELCELRPFRALIESGIDMIMSSHILFPAVDPDVPATLSRKIMTGLLRERLGFEGIIVTDCLMMQAIARHYGTVPGSVMACDAGVDMVMVCHDPALAGECCAAMAEKCDPAIMEAAALRIARRKERLPEMGDASDAGRPENKAAVRRMREEAVTHVGAELPPLGDRPLFVGCAADRVSLVGNAEIDGLCMPQAFRARFGGERWVTTYDPDDAEIDRAVEKAHGSTCIVLGLYNGHVRKGQLRLMERLAALGIPMICAALRDSYDLAALPENACGLAVYEYSAESLDVLADVLAGELAAPGRLGVNLEGVVCA